MREAHNSKFKIQNSKLPQATTQNSKLKIQNSYMKITIINGPNLNMLGTREPSIYGNTSFEQYLNQLCRQYPDVDIDYYQSNIEGVLIDKLQEAGFESDGIILNAGAYTHTSVALLDCIRSISAPVIEVHISNVHKREEFRHKSMMAAACLGVISGFGMNSYRLALEALLDWTAERDPMKEE